VSKYNGEAFNEGQFFAWFDRHGSSAYGGPDGKLDLKEFGWYLADIACGFGEALEARAAAMPAIISEFEEKLKEVADAAKYDPIIAGSLDAIKSLFDKLDANGSGLLEKAELKEVVSKYNGEAFNEGQFFAWFDRHGSSAYGGPDGKLDLKEFGWYLADIACGFGEANAQRRAALPQIILQFFELSAPPPLTLTITAIKAFGVPDADLRRGSGKSDPYCKFTVLGVDKPPTAQTATVANSQNPEWGATLKLALPSGFTTGEMRVRVWDDDVTKEDDAIGSTVVVIEPPGGACTAKCKGRELAGTAGYVLPDFDVSFEYTIA